MRLAFFLSILLATSILEVALLPALLRLDLPLLSLVTLIVGTSVLGGRDRLWFALGGGMTKDLLALSSAFIHGLFALLLLAIFWIFEALFQLEEPASRIVKIGLGLAAWPFLWALAGWMTAPGAGGYLKSLSQALLGRDFLFAFIFLVSSAFFFLARARAGSGEAHRSL